MVKPTSGICCEFAQKHDAEFMQNFFEKLLDKSVCRVYNDIVPETTGTETSRTRQKECRNKKATEGGIMNIGKPYEYTGKGRGKLLSPVSGKEVERGIKCVRVLLNADGGTGYTIPLRDISAVRWCKRWYAPNRGSGVTTWTPESEQAPVSVRIIIPNDTDEEKRLAPYIKGLLLTSGFEPESARGFEFNARVTSGSWTAWMQAHAAHYEDGKLVRLGHLAVGFRVADELTGLSYEGDLETFNPKGEKVLEIQRLHKTATSAEKKRNKAEITK